MKQKDLVIAIVQEKPAYLNLAASMDKAKKLIAQAAEQGAGLIVFGETWFCGYPAWIDHLPNIALWGYGPTEEVFLQMMESAMEVPGKEVQELEKLAARYKIHIVLGLNERVRSGAGQGTLYNSLLIISNSGELLLHHRKLMPTYTEKLLYGLGDGHGLKSVDCDFGKLGALICWEHWMPLTRQAMHLEGEHIHIALWPAVHELHQLASRHYAFESQAYVVAVGQVLQVKDLPSFFELPEALAKDKEKYLLNGGSAIIAPDSSYVLAPQYDKAGLLIHEITNLDKAIKGRLRIDVSGHYNRPDVFKLEVDKRRN